MVLFFFSVRGWSADKIPFLFFLNTHSGATNLAKRSRIANFSGAIEGRYVLVLARGGAIIEAPLLRILNFAGQKNEINAEPGRSGMQWRRKSLLAASVL